VAWGRGRGGGLVAAFDGFLNFWSLLSGQNGQKTEKSQKKLMTRLDPPAAANRYSGSIFRVRVLGSKPAVDMLSHRGWMVAGFA